MSDLNEAVGEAIAATVDTITKLRAALAALDALICEGACLSAIDAAETKARALDALRSVELREEQHEREREAHRDRLAATAAHAAYLTAHVASSREQADALRAILAEVTRRP